MPTWLRSVFSIVVGFAVFYALQGACSYAALHVLQRNFDTPTAGYLVSNLLYTFVSAVIGGYVAARIAHRSPVAHGLALAILMALLSIQSIIKGFGSQETWFVLARAAGAPLFAVVGAALDARRHQRKMLG